MREVWLPSDEEIQDLNLLFKEGRLAQLPRDIAQKRKTVLDQKGIRAVTVCFSDLEGRFHTLDYDKDFLLAHENNLTFDGSSIRGFTDQGDSDLRLEIDWAAFYILPPDIVGTGKVYVFGNILDKDRSIYPADIRGVLKKYLEDRKSASNLRFNVSAEIEGFLFSGVDAEKKYLKTRKLQFVTESGYFSTLPQSPLRQFIDRAADAHRMCGFENEKDHGEVACSQFEMTWRYTDALIAADQIQLYKMLCRQVAELDGHTASFLPKPVVGLNGNGMHLNISVSDNKDNLFYCNSSSSESGFSAFGQNFIDGVLRTAKDLCLIMNSSVNSYRRLDPAFEAPNRIQSSGCDRSSMIRIPLADEQSTRIEVRSIAPDANPYLLIYSIIKAGMDGTASLTSRAGEMFLQSNINDAIYDFGNSDFITELMGEDAKKKYIRWKTEVARRSPAALGKNIKTSEIMFHHEITNQYLWQMF